MNTVLTNLTEEEIMHIVSEISLEDDTDINKISDDLTYYTTLLNELLDTHESLQFEKKVTGSGSLNGSSSNLFRDNSILSLNDTLDSSKIKDVLARHGLAGNVVSSPFSVRETDNIQAIVGQICERLKTGHKKLMAKISSGENTDKDSMGFLLEINDSVSNALSNVEGFFPDIFSRDSAFSVAGTSRTDYSIPLDEKGVQAKLQQSKLNKSAPTTPTDSDDKTHIFVPISSPVLSTNLDINGKIKELIYHLARSKNRMQLFMYVSQLLPYVELEFSKRDSKNHPKSNDNSVFSIISKSEGLRMLISQLRFTVNGDISQEESFDLEYQLSTIIFLIVMQEEESTVLLELLKDTSLGMLVLFQRIVQRLKAHPDSNIKCFSTEATYKRRLYATVAKLSLILTLETSSIGKDKASGTVNASAEPLNLSNSSTSFFGGGNGFFNFFTSGNSSTKPEESNSPTLNPNLHSKGKKTRIVDTLEDFLNLLVLIDFDQKASASTSTSASVITRSRSSSQSQQFVNLDTNEHSTNSGADSGSFLNSLPSLLPQKLETSMVLISLTLANFAEIYECRARIIASKCLRLIKSYLQTCNQNIEYYFNNIVEIHESCKNYYSDGENFSKYHEALYQLSLSFEVLNYLSLTICCLVSVKDSNLGSIFDITAARSPGDAYSAGIGGIGRLEGAAFLPSDGDEYTMNKMIMDMEIPLVIISLLSFLTQMFNTSSTASSALKLLFPVERESSNSSSSGDKLSISNPNSMSSNFSYRGNVFPRFAITCLVRSCFCLSNRSENRKIIIGYNIVGTLEDLVEVALGVMYNHSSATSSADDDISSQTPPGGMSRPTRMKANSISGSFLEKEKEKDHSTQNVWNKFLNSTSQPIKSRESPPLLSGSSKQASLSSIALDAQRPLLSGHEKGKVYNTEVTIFLLSLLSFSLDSIHLYLEDSTKISVPETRRRSSSYPMAPPITSPNNNTSMSAKTSEATSDASRTSSLSSATESGSSSPRGALGLSPSNQSLVNLNINNLVESYHNKSNFTKCLTHILHFVKGIASSSSFSWNSQNRCILISCRLAVLKVISSISEYKRNIQILVDSIDPLVDKADIITHLVNLISESNISKELITEFVNISSVPVGSGSSKCDRNERALSMPSLSRESSNSSTTGRTALELLLGSSTPGSASHLHSDSGSRGYTSSGGSTPIALNSNCSRKYYGSVTDPKSPSSPITVSASCFKRGNIEIPLDTTLQYRNRLIEAISCDDTHAYENLEEIDAFLSTDHLGIVNMHKDKAMGVAHAGISGGTKTATKVAISPKSPKASSSGGGEHLKFRSRAGSGDFKGESSPMKPLVRNKLYERIKKRDNDIISGKDKDNDKNNDNGISNSNSNNNSSKKHQFGSGSGKNLEYQYSENTDELSLIENFDNFESEPLLESKFNIHLTSFDNVFYLDVNNFFNGFILANLINSVSAVNIGSNQVSSLDLLDEELQLSLRALHNIAKSDGLEKYAERIYAEIPQICKSTSKSKSQKESTAAAKNSFRLRSNSQNLAEAMVDNSLFHQKPIIFILIHLSRLTFSDQDGAGKISSASIHNANLVVKSLKILVNLIPIVALDASFSFDLSVLILDTLTYNMLTLSAFERSLTPSILPSESVLFSVQRESLHCIYTLQQCNANVVCVKGKNKYDNSSAIREMLLTDEILVAFNTFFRSHSKNRDLAKEIMHNAGFFDPTVDFRVCQYNLDKLRTLLLHRKLIDVQNDHFLFCRRRWVTDLFEIESENAHKGPSLENQDYKFSIQPFWDILNVGRPSNDTSSSTSALLFSQSKASSNNYNIFQNTFFGLLPVSLSRPICDTIDIGLGYIGGSNQPVTPEFMDRDLSSHPTGGGLGSLSRAGSQIQKQNPDTRDYMLNITRMPENIRILFDLLYVSKLIYEMYIMDMISIGKSNSSYSDSSSKSLELAPLLTPDPRNIVSFLLPSREYHSFIRDGEVIKHIIPDVNASCPDVKYVFSFNESEFSHEFQASLLDILKTENCKNVVGLSFSGTEVKVEEEANMGWLIGHLPSSIRFVNVKGILSRFSIETMCILLRQNYALFLSLQNNTIKSTQKSEKQESNVRYFGEPSNGVIALSMTHTRLATTEVREICNLLALNLYDFYTTNSHITHRYDAPGLRFLDLSHNQLNDQDCSQLIRAAAQGPLEALDLGGNSITKGVMFMEQMRLLLSDIDDVNTLEKGGGSPGSNHSISSLFSMDHPKIYHLRHLGLRNNGLQSKRLVVLLDILSKPSLNNNLTSLDVSNNEIANSEQLKDSLRLFLKTNKKMRNLDLSKNKLTSDPIKAIHIGLLENDTMLRLLLHDNGNVKEYQKTFEFIQDKLSANRKLYKRISLMRRYNKIDAVKASEVETTVFSTASPDQGNSGGVVNAVPVLDDRQFNFSNSNNSSVARAVPVTSLMSSTPPAESKVIEEPKGGHVGAHSTPEFKKFRVPIEVSTDVISTGGSGGSRGSNISINARINDAINNDSNYNNRNISSKSNVSNASEKSITSLPPTSTSYTAASASGPSGTPSGGALFVRDNTSESLSKSLEVSPDINITSLQVLFSSPLAWRDKNHQLHPLEVLDYKTEMDALRQLFKDINRHDVNLVFDFATTDGLLRSITQPDCRALHFSGHGHPKCLNFEDGHAGLQLVSVDTLKRLLKVAQDNRANSSSSSSDNKVGSETDSVDFKTSSASKTSESILAIPTNLQFVFVSACYSRNTGQAFVDSGVKSVVCVKMNDSLLDSSANVFTKLFYINLFSGKSVKQSFSIAKEAVKSSPIVPDAVVEGDKFILLPEDSPHHDQIIFPYQHNMQYRRQNEYSDEQSSFSGSSDTLKWRPETHIFTRGANSKAWFEDGISGIQVAKRSNYHNANSVVVPGQGGDLIRRLSNSRLEVPLPPSGDLIRRLSNSRLELPLPPSVSSEFLSDSSSSLSLSVPPSATQSSRPSKAQYYVTKSIPSCAHDFEGREIDMYKTILTLYMPNKRLVSIIGEDGVGKSALIVAVCNYLADRGGYLVQDGILFVKARNISDHFSMLFAIHYALTQRASNQPETKVSGENENVDEIYKLEEEIVSILAPLKLLLVIDNFDSLTSHANSDVIDDVKVFFGRIFERCRFVKVLMTSSFPLGSGNRSSDAGTRSRSHSNSYVGVTEHVITLGPLNIRSSLRLFARLSPILLTASAKSKFVSECYPKNLIHVSAFSNMTIRNSDLTADGQYILGKLGDGYPSEIIKLASESTHECIDSFLNDLQQRYAQPSSAQNYNI